ncbi:type VII secretion-associated serine protease mycosin, partial [Streptomyces rhizosphaericola]
TPPPADGDPVNWAAPLAGGLGAALLAAAVVLWRGHNAPGRR